MKHGIQCILSVFVCICPVFSAAVSLADESRVVFRGPDGTEYRVQAGPPAGKTAAAKTADVAGVSASYATENSIQGFVYRMYNVALEREPEEEGFNF